MFKDSDYPLFGKPVGEGGRLLLEEMNIHHRQLSEWALSKVPKMRPKKMLDIGCGGGMLISLLSKMYPKAQIFGVDISEESVNMTKKVNADIVREGRCHVSLDSVSELPFPPGTFDMVTAFETYFFWPDLENDIRKVSSVLRKGGILVIVSELYPHPRFDERNDEAARQCGLRLRTNDEMASIMEGCGLTVAVNTDEDKNWVAFVGRK